MQQRDNLNRRLGISSRANTFKNGKQTLNSAYEQQPLDEIGGEPLVGSGFESEDPESEFEPTGEESEDDGSVSEFKPSTPSGAS